MTDCSEDRSISWVDVSPSSIAPAAYAPYGPGEIDGLFDWGEDPNGRAVHVAPYRGQLIVDIVEFDPNAVHQPSKPGDEIVVVLNGTLRLTTDCDQSELIVDAGETVLIPAGWAGIYRVTSTDGPFREFTIVPADYFTLGTAPAPNQSVPRLIRHPHGDGAHTLFSNRYVLEAESRDQARSAVIDAKGDIIILVIAGQLTLGAGDGSKAFGPRSSVVLPNGFSGRASYSSDFRALNVRWLD